ncbi:carbohydrate-binding domain-containing protein [Pelagicoccus mobilis]|uniref:Right-handed parallel beta-helix repeat-containing protein n=1 Tax=Pelagicoccus mobilis TaxID=415221 RepID=A0A934S2U2_9BACT|nr:carbohydrate-binding domain-containing protein [Pelagicoccus mobilis]MBK1880064.1 right-handed parallel beta-helix repeat-containing protein [Pelagicoccus mobilis]
MQFAKGENFYVSLQGDDANSGSLESPFRTIGKAASVMSSGDVCLIRGGTYRERVVVPTDDLTFQRYQNEQVVVSGADLVTNWSQYSGEIYRAPLSWDGHEFTQVFFEGKHQQIARYPDNATGEMMSVEVESGYMSCTTYNETGDTRRVTFADMADFPDNHWQGGLYRGITGRIRSNTMGDILSSSGKDLTCTPLTNEWINGNDEWFMGGGAAGYILHLNALSREGEWWHEDGYLYFWQPGGGSPDGASVEAQVREEAFVINGRSGVVLDGIEVNAATLTLQNSDDCRLLNCSFEFVQPYIKTSGYSSNYGSVGGVYIEGDRNEIDSCYFAHSWGHLLYINSGSGNRVTNSVFKDNGWYSIFSSSIHNRSAAETVIEYNTFGATGRFHIRTDANEKITIRYNDFYDCMKMGQDAGSIESVGKDLKDSIIAYNTLHDSSTLRLLNAGFNKQYVVAFYIEDTSNYTAHHNVAWNFNNDKVPGSMKDGAFSYLGPRDSQQSGIRYYNNTAWNCDFRIRVWDRGGSISTQHWNNIFDSSMDDVFGDLEAGFDFQNSGFIDPEDEDANFENALGGHFTLLEGSTAIDSGRIIEGITDGYAGDAPDIGAIEQGSFMWRTGASIESSLKQLSFGEVLPSGSDIVVEAEDFDEGGPGIAYHDLSLGNEGGVYREENVDLFSIGSEEVAVGSTVGGEWLEYTLDVQPGDYVLKLKTSAKRANRSIRVDLDGEALATVAIPNTGGLDVFEEVSTKVTVNSVSKGRLRVNFISGGTNLDSISLLSDEASELSYQDWVTGYQLVGADADMHADPDGDDVSNVLEYAFGGDPTDAKAVGVRPRLTSVGQNLGIQFLQANTADAVLQYVLETSPDLSPGSWQPLEIASDSVTDLGAGFSKVEQLLRFEERSQFVRMRVISAE